MSTTYGPADQPITITLASLGDGAARESEFLQNTGPYDDILVFGRTLAQSDEGGLGGLLSVSVYVYGSFDGVNFTSMASGVDAAYTPLGAVFNPNAPFPQPGPIGIIKVQTHDISCKAGPWNLRTMFGEQLPPYWGIIVKNDLAQILSSDSADHAFTWQGVFFT